MERIRIYLQENGEARMAEIAEYIGLSNARVREILNEMYDVESIGANKNRLYRLR